MPHQQNPGGRGLCSWWRHLPPGEGGFSSRQAQSALSKVIVAANDDSETIDANLETIEMVHQREERP